MTQTGGQGAKTEELDLFYEEVKKSHSSPLWTIEQTAPPRRVLPFLWRWQDFRPLMYKAARLVPIEQAERRVLVFANPGLTDARRPGATTTLYANLQVINPGEIARTHRHSASALRLVVEGKGAWTAVEGEKTYMEPGDFVTTPNWTWHDHGHEGTEPMVWLDGLDVPVVQSMEVSFYEQAPTLQQDLTKPNDLSQRLYGAGSLRPTWTKHDGVYSPLINYKFAHVYDVLRRLAKDTDGSPFDGVCLEYTNPLTGKSALATIACFAQLLQPGQRTKAHRHTGATIYHVIQGKGYSVIDGTRFEWEDKDTFVVPSWAFHEHEAQRESVLFSYNDSPLLQPTGLYREEPLADNGGHQQVMETFKAGPAA